MAVCALALPVPRDPCGCVLSIRSCLQLIRAGVAVPQACQIIWACVDSYQLAAYYNEYMTKSIMVSQLEDTGGLLGLFFQDLPRYKRRARTAATQRGLRPMDPSDAKAINDTVVCDRTTHLKQVEVRHAPVPCFPAGPRCVLVCSHRAA